MEVRKPEVEKVHQTDIGVLPLTWEACTLGSISTLLNGRAYGLAEWEQSGTPVIRLQNLTGGNEYYYSNLRLADGKYCSRGDLLYMWSATFGPYIWQGDKAIYHYHIWKVVPKPNRSDRTFLYHKLSEITALKKATSTNGGTMLHLTKREMESTLVAVPPLQEQEAIAEALSDADALIESLSLLLAKKRQIKQGAMQELLTGKKRLPGFESAWRDQQLCELGDFLKGRGITRDEAKSGNLPCVRYGEIYTHHREVIQQYESWISPVVALRATRLRSGDILFAGSGETKAEIGKCTAFVSSDEAYAGGDIVILRTRGVCVTFLSYLLNTPRVQALKASRGQGDAVVHISSAALAEIEVSMPDLDEQTAIAETLSEMDGSIDLLQTKLDKAMEIKQGMMQALLTGRIRLVKLASNVIPLPTKPAATKPTRAQSAHNWQINEAVVIGVLAQRFGSEKMPLGRKRRVKLTYLLHRHAEGRAEGYLKKAAGPYDPNTKYNGPEKIALKNGYVRALRNEKYEGFVAGDKTEQAQRYFEQWYGEAALAWLERFHYRKTEELELLATVDMAMVDLAANGEPADVASVKRIIAAHPEWLPKLSRELFSDERIAATIAECQTLFGG